MILDQIINGNDLTKVFDKYFDFRIEDVSLLSDRWQLISESKVSVFGSDSTGSVFGVLGEGDIELLPVVYLSSEGQAGVIAKTIKEFIELIVFLPAWRDLIYSETEAEITQTAKEIEESMQEILPDLPCMKIKVSGLLQLNDKLVIRNLAKVVNNAYLPKVWGDDGEEFGSLFE